MLYVTENDRDRDVYFSFHLFFLQHRMFLSKDIHVGSLLNLLLGVRRFGFRLRKHMENEGSSNYWVTAG